MPRLEDLLDGDVIHAVRSDGSKIIAMKVNFGEKNQLSGKYSN